MKKLQIYLIRTSNSTALMEVNEDGVADTVRVMQEVGGYVSIKVYDAEALLDTYWTDPCGKWQHVHYVTPYARRSV